MIPDEYVWFIWSISFLVPWAAVYLAVARLRRTMLWASVFTAPFGLTEPLFVPEYWNPPSLFDLAARTGFDIESLIFCFGIGGVGSVTFAAISRRVMRPLSIEERATPRHRYHRVALLTPFALFLALVGLPWNPIYASILAMLGGAVAAMSCRPDLKWAMAIGGGAFLVYYLIFLVGLEVTAPGYIERIWNLDALSGVRMLSFPIEEILFAVAFGMYWAGVYEHATWHRGIHFRGEVARK